MLLKSRPGFSFRRHVAPGLVVLVALAAGAAGGLYLRGGEPRMTTRTLAATADTYVNQQRPDRSYGDALLLRADAPPQTFRSYLRFDIPPDLGRVESMTLKIHVRSKSARGLAVHAVDSGWDETSITWVTAPKPGARLGSLSPTDRSGWYAARLALPGQPGAHLNLAIVSTSKTMAAFDSREFGSAAQLLLTESKSG